MRELLSKYVLYFDLILALGMPFVHFTIGPARSKRSRHVLFGLILIWLFMFLGYGFLEKVSVLEIFVALVSYSIVLFVFLSEVLMTGGAARLTSQRGEIWTKEIDYFYLGLAAIGLVVSLGQLRNMSNKIALPDTIGPLILATAIVLRAIKTRAEIGGWNKPGYGVSKT